MITERDAMEYEVFGSAWTGFIPFQWLRVVLAWLLARRVSTRYDRYRAQKECGSRIVQHIDGITIREHIEPK